MAVARVRSYFRTRKGKRARVSSHTRVVPTTIRHTASINRKPSKWALDQPRYEAKLRDEYQAARVLSSIGRSARRYH